MEHLLFDPGNGSTASKAVDESEQIVVADEKPSWRLHMGIFVIVP